MTCIDPEKTPFTLTVKDKITGKDLLIRGTAFLPRKENRVENKFSTICLCHGIPGGNPAPVHSPGEEGLPVNYPALARWFSEKGLAAFTFNFRGTGESGGNFDLGEWPKDLRAVLDFIFQHPRIQKKRVSLVGFSGGAAVSIYTASRDPRIHRVVSLACPADFHLLINENNLGEEIKRLRKIGIIRDPGFPPDPKAWMNRALSLRPLKHIAKLSPRPVLIIHGEKDELVPPKHALDLFRAASRPREIILIEEAGHRLRSNQQALHHTLAWLKKEGDAGTFHGTADC